MKLTKFCLGCLLVPVGLITLSLPVQASVPPAIMAQASWQNFSSPDGQFTVRVPSNPEEQVQENGKLYIVTAPDPALYAVAYIDTPNIDTARLDTQKKARDAAIAEYLRGGNFQLKREEELANHPYLGKEIEFVFSQNTNAQSGIARFFIFGQRVYGVIVITPSSENRQRFLDSFQFMESD